MGGVKGCHVTLVSLLLTAAYGLRQRRVSTLSIYLRIVVVVYAGLGLSSPLIDHVTSGLHHLTGGMAHVPGSK